MSSGDFGKRLGCPEARDGKRGSFPADARDGRSVSPEKGGRQWGDDNRGPSGGYEYGRPDSRIGRQSPGSPGSSPEPEDNSSTSGDEGIVLLSLCRLALTSLAGMPRREFIFPAQNDEETRGEGCTFFR